MDVTQMIRDGLLRVDELDPEKNYVFRLGNDNYRPTQEDLEAFRDILEKLGEGRVGRGEGYVANIIIAADAFEIQEIWTPPVPELSRVNRLDEIED